MKIKNKLKNEKKVKKENNVGEKERKLVKITKKILFIAVCVILLELVIMLITYLKRENNISYIDTINSIKLIDNKYYLGAGSSNFRYSKFNDIKKYKYAPASDGDNYKNVVAEQAKLVKYDLNMDVIWEKTFECDYDSSYYDAIKVSDGYLAVGSYIYNYSQIEEYTRDGLIVKYNDDGNIVWYKNYQVLGDTEFYKVIEVKDGYIAIGQSIYENMELGNHTSGGGIIVKYDYDGNVLWFNNFGGNKSGCFKDIIVVDDGYIVCGKDGANYGLLVKFSNNGNIVWHYSTYELAITDNSAFNAMALYDNKLYIASSINYSDEVSDKDEPIYKFKGCVYVYDLNGKCLKKYRSDKCEVFEDLIVSDTGIILIGHTNKTASSYANQTGIIAKMSLDGKEIVSDYFGGMNNDVLTTIIDNNSDYLVCGYSNSFGNKKDFNVIYRNVSKNINIIYEKN